MSGFIDVTGWTTEEVRRLGHADDCDDVDHRPRRNFKRNPHGYNSASRTANLPEIGHSISDVWAAACAAHRVNGGYHKENVYEWDEVGQVNKMIMRKNRDIMMEFLANPDRLLVEDVERGEHCRQFLQNDLTFRTLKGKISEFDTAIKKVLAVQDRFYTVSNRYELAIAACLPQSVERSEVRQASESRVQFAQGGLVGKIGDKVNLQVEVLSSNWSKQYNTFWIRAVTEADQPVFFSNKDKFDVGTHLAIKGTVKAHRDNLTQLNRVKVL